MALQVTTTGHTRPGNSHLLYNAPRGLCTAQAAFLPKGYPLQLAACHLEECLFGCSQSGRGSPLAVRFPLAAISDRLTTLHQGPLSSIAPRMEKHWCRAHTHACAHAQREEEGRPSSLNDGLIQGRAFAPAPARLPARGGGGVGESI